MRTATLAAARQPAAVAATALSEEGVPDGDDRSPVQEADPGLQERPRDLDLPPWLKGRYGTAVGRAVHGVLQVIDLAGGAGLEDAVAAQCHAEAIPTRADAVARLVRAALTAPVVVAAARLPHWREVYAATPLEDGRLLEGYIDLLYRGPHGLVIVDYKTAATAAPSDLDRRVAGYRMRADESRAGSVTTSRATVTKWFTAGDGSPRRHDICRATRGASPSRGRKATPDRRRSA